MQAALAIFHEAHAAQSPGWVSEALSPVPPPDNPGRLYEFVRASNEHQVEGDIRYAIKFSKVGRLSPKESNAWTDIFVSYWKAVGAILRAEEARNQHKLGDRQLLQIYDTWKEVVNNLIKYLQNGTLPHWVVMVLHRAANHLRLFAIDADEHLAKSKPVTFSSDLSDDVVSSAPRNEKLEESARLFNRVFALCLGDRNPDLSESRKWGVYAIANLQFKTYFKLKNVSLSKNVVRSIQAQSDLPDFKLYPAAHRVTYKYYVGVLEFLQENYPKAEEHLTEAWDACYPSSHKNQELILNYLIPCCLITKHKVPSKTLLSGSLNLQRIFGPLAACIKSGDLVGFDAALQSNEPELVKRRIFLTLERSRDIAMRNLFRKVYLAAGYEDLKEGQTEKDRIRKSRIPLVHFATALRMGIAGEGSGQYIEDEEVECLLANLIYKGLMKGYISREHQMVVLNKKGAFPGTGV